MRTIRSKKDIEAFLQRLSRRARSAGPSILSATAGIIESVRRKGDRALIRYTKKFDGHSNLRLKASEINRLASMAKPETLRALKLAAGRIRKFHARQLESTWTVKENGITLGQLIRPLSRVGVYVPGGKASYPSTVLMNVIPAQVAGVPEIAVAVPTPRGEADPNVMAAIRLLGIKEVYTIGGAQAVAAFAFGTETVKKVDKITGPGNVFVATAKRMVFGDVDIDMIAGPSEILVIADSTANPAFVAADLLSQAEHDELASAVLVTDSAELASEVDKELSVQLKALRRRTIAAASLRAYGAAIIVKNLSDAVKLSNRIAPEHLEVMTASPGSLLNGLRNAGAIFLGSWSPEPMGDYAAGPNHTLPTGATAHWASPLGVYDFVKRTSILEFTREGFMRLAGTVELLASEEGLEAHARSVSVRRAAR